MSNNIVPIQVTEVVPALCDLEVLNKRQYAVLSGSQDVTWQPYLAQNVNSSTIQITSIPPSNSTIVDPLVFVKVTYRLVFAGTNTVGGNLIQIGQFDSARAWPLSQTTATVTATINGSAVSTILNQYFNALINYSEYADKLNEYLSCTPTQLDQCQQYSDLNNTNRSPFRPFGDNVVQPSRGAFSGINIISNTATACTLDLTVYEPIMLPGFYGNRSGLINIRTLQWLFTFGNLNRVWSHDNVSGNTITSQTTSITAFQLIYRFITPKILEKVPTKCIYPYSEIVPSNQSAPAVLAGAQTTIAMSALNLQAIPSRIYVYVRKQDSDLTAFDADAFFRIDNVSVNFMNRTGLMASMSSQDLWLESWRNGLKRSWDEWNKYNGSVLCICLGKTIGLSSLYAPGLLSYPQLSMSVTCTNLANSTITPMLFVQVVYEGAMTIADGSMSKSTAVLSNMDVLNTQTDGKMPVIEKKSDSYFGSGIIDDVGALFRGFADNFKNASKVGQDIVGAIAPGLGIGKGRKKGKGGSLIQAGNVSGGRMISRDELADVSEEFYE